jgi:hypothetical protein
MKEKQGLRGILRKIRMTGLGGPGYPVDKKRTFVVGIIGI